MKYNFTGEEQTINGVLLKRIQRLSDNKIGGWIEKESNLTHDGDAWVSGDAQVSGDAWERSPLYIQGTRHALTNCKFGFIQIGCQCLSFGDWKENGKTIAISNGYTKEEIKEYGEYIKLFCKIGK